MLSSKPRYRIPNTSLDLELSNLYIPIPKSAYSLLRRTTKSLTAFRIIPPFGFLRHILRQLRKPLPNNIRNLAIAEIPRRDEKSLSPSFFQLGGFDVREGEVAHLDPDEGAGFGDGVFGFAGHDVADALVGGVEGGEGLEVVDYGAED